jgi:hypothetical protein
VLLHETRSSHRKERKKERQLVELYHSSPGERYPFKYWRNHTPSTCAEEAPLVEVRSSTTSLQPSRRRRSAREVCISQQPPRSIRTGPREGSKVSGVIVTERQLLVTALALGLFQRGRSRGVEPRAEVRNRSCSPHRPPSFLECLSRSVGWNRGLETCCVGEQLVKHVDGSFEKRPSYMHWDAAGEVGLVRGEGKVSNPHVCCAVQGVCSCIDRTLRMEVPLVLCLLLDLRDAGLDVYSRQLIEQLSLTRQAEDST